MPPLLSFRKRFVGEGFIPPGSTRQIPHKITFPAPQSHSGLAAPGLFQHRTLSGQCRQVYR